MKTQSKDEHIVRYKSSTLKKMQSETDYAKLDALKDEDINYSDIPEADADFWKRAQVIDCGPKKPISIRLDQDILEWFKTQKGRYQKRINQVLRHYMEAHSGLQPARKVKK